MTATQSVQLYQKPQEHFGKNENAAKAVSAIEAIIDEKVSTGNTWYEELLHRDLEILRDKTAVEFAKNHTEIRKQKSEILKPIYVVGLVQFLAIVDSIGIFSFVCSCAKQEELFRSMAAYSGRVNTSAH